MTTPTPRELTISEATEIRILVGNAHDDVKRDGARAIRNLERVLLILDQAGYPINRA